MIRICAFADEAATDLSGQITALKENGISLIEIRGINDKNVSEFTEEEAREYAAAFADAGIEVWSIGSTLGKISIDDDLEEHFKLVRHVCRLAKIFGTDKIRMFSFKKAYEKETEVFEALRRMVEIAREENVKLYHENERGIFGDVPDRILKIAENVEGLSYVYDPANFLGIGLLPEETIEKLYGMTDYFHVKDVILDGKEQVPAGQGDGRFDVLLGRVSDDKTVVFTIEHHLKVVAPDDTEKIEKLKEKGKKYYTDPREAFDTAVNAFKDLLVKVGYSETNGIYHR
ncbi:MAG: sugar phosphate isomerase/epimerase [Clostridia bacterium]|nr:sugar phosphate isomerase/epimerase [Clostridia bacterium]